jgi:hypothetical protein
MLELGKTHICTSASVSYGMLHAYCADRQQICRCYMLMYTP